MTKEELLQKGITEDLADEIVASFSDDTDGDPLQALRKAIDAGQDGDLFKAKGGEGKGKDEEDEDEEDEDKNEYNERYMKKHMKRYMKENEKEFEGDLKKCFGNMKKAAEIDSDSDGAVVEMADLQPFLNSQVDMIDGLCKAISEINEKVNEIAQQTDKNQDIMLKAAKVQVEQADSVNKFLSGSQTGGPRGIVATKDMQKAMNNSKDSNVLAYKTLMKATLNGDKNAGQIISAFESVGKNLSRLTASQQQYVNDLVKAEGN